MNAKIPVFVIGVRIFVAIYICYYVICITVPLIPS